MTQENLEPQDEMKEVLNEEPQDGLQEGPQGGQEEVDKVAEQVKEEFAQDIEDKFEGLDKSDPKVKAGMELMKEQMQELFNKRVGKVIGKTKAQMAQFEAELDSRMEQKFQEFEQKFGPKKEPPKFDNYDGDVDRWANDLAKYNIEQASQKNTPKPVNNIETKFHSLIQEIHKKDPDLINSFIEKEREYYKSHPDYADNVEVLKVYAVKNPALLEAIYDAGPEVADYITSDSDKLDELVRMGPARLGRAIAKIEDGFKRSKPLPKKANPKPEPISEIRGANTTKQLDSLDHASYSDLMNKKQYGY